MSAMDAGMDAQIRAMMGGMGGFGMGGDDDEDDDDRNEFGFTQDETMDLLSQGVKPWEDDAHAVLAAPGGLICNPPACFGE